MNQAIGNSVAADGEVIAYFGYGSLVNPNTHRTNIIDYERATLSGFRRTWQARPDDGDYPIALLSSSPGIDDDVLDGLLIYDLKENLGLLDEREAGYDRIEVAPNQVEVTGGQIPRDCPIYVYCGRAPFDPKRQHYILQSYLDAVLQGYLHQYGEVGVRGFVETTARFETPLLMDRTTPLYPRAVELGADEASLFDDLTQFMRKTDSLP